jgi:hypothetical protein
LVIRNNHSFEIMERATIIKAGGRGTGIDNAVTVAVAVATAALALAEI